jgi:hypothetical protein
MPTETICKKVCSICIVFENQKEFYKGVIEKEREKREREEREKMREREAETDRHKKENYQASYWHSRELVSHKRIIEASVRKFNDSSTTAAKNKPRCHV